MIDENETGAPTEDAALAATIEAPVQKKPRAPRRSPAEMAAASAAKSTKTSKRTVKAKTMPTSAERKAVETSSKSRSKNVAQSAGTVVPSSRAGDEFADLLQLEEDNKQLRAALAEKLRAENADLRKRLGA